MKQKIGLIAVVGIVISLLAYGSLAYFSDSETANNVMTFGNIDMTLHDETTGGDPFPEDGMEDVMPTDVIDKKVYVENVGKNPFYLRIKLEKTINPKDDNNLNLLTSEEISSNLNFDYITLDINTSDWTEKDGWYYYNKLLQMGDESTPLFNTVTFGREMGNEYANTHFRIKVIAQAVQSQNNGESPLDADGWPSEDENINDDGIDEGTDPVETTENLLSTEASPEELVTTETSEEVE